MRSLPRLYALLRARYGHPRGQWHLWCKRPKTVAERERVMIEAILTQRTNWRNVERAVKVLQKRKLLSLEKLRRLRKRPSALYPFIRSAGFYKTKAGYLISLAAYVVRKGGVRALEKIRTETLRHELLDLPGIGPETADSILLYALHKPSFVIDEYTRRLVRREHLASNMSYDHLKIFFEQRMRKDYRLYQDLHALIVIDGKAK